MSDKTSERKRYLVVEIESAIGAMIVSGRAAGGERLTTDLLPPQLRSVSRNIWREAMQQLSVRGLVQPIKRKGTVVTARSQWNLLDLQVLRWFGETGKAHELVRDMSEIRWMIEPFAARLAAERASAEELEAINAAFAALQSYVAGTLTDPLVDTRLHVAILTASGNAMLRGLRPVMAHIMDASLSVTTVPVTEASVAKALEIHEEVVRAINDRDPARAEATMRELVRFAYEPWGGVVG